MKIHDIIKKCDSQNQFQILKDTYLQAIEAWENKIELRNLETNDFSSIVFCGLGGSAISGDLLEDYLADELKIIFNVVRGYHLPHYVNDHTLVIISSYSGNTEETISCIEEAIKRKSKILVITSGGKIGDIASKHQFSTLKISSGFQPRYALGLSFFSLLKIMQTLGFVDETKLVKSIIDLWKKKAIEYSAENSYPLQIAEQILGFVPVIYSAEFLSSVGYRLKCQFNENSKLHAFHNSIPEMNHNEIIGWESYSEKLFNSKVIYFLDEHYHPQIKKRFDFLRNILAEQKIDIVTLSSPEANKKVRIMDLIFLSDWISFYLSVLRGFDPSEIDFIHRMKKQLT